MILVDVYLIKESRLDKKIEQFTKNSEISHNFLSYDEIDELQYTKRSCDVIIIEEYDSFVDTVDIFDKLVSLYENSLAIIIISNNSDIYNVVKWMRKGASDYILKNLFNEEIFYNSINGSLEFVNKALTPKESNNQSYNNYANDRISLPTNFDWNNLPDNEAYDMSLVMISFNIEKELVSRYSKNSIEKLYDILKNEISVMSQKFGGKIWVVQPNSLILSFHFGDYINASVLFALYFFNRFFLLCLEKLKLDEILYVKLSVHAGNCFFHKTNTEQITSDVINSLVHLETQYNSFGNLVISESVYDKLSQRVSSYFEYSDIFENKKIYSYREKS